jgi:hypothetical protein
MKAKMRRSIRVAVLVVLWSGVASAQSIDLSHCDLVDF